MVSWQTCHCFWTDAPSFLGPRVAQYRNVPFPHLFLCLLSLPKPTSIWYLQVSLYLTLCFCPNLISHSKYIFSSKGANAILCQVSSTEPLRPSPRCWAYELTTVPNSVPTWVHSLCHRNLATQGAILPRMWPNILNIPKTLLWVNSTFFKIKGEKTSVKNIMGEIVKFLQTLKG